MDTSRIRDDRDSDAPRRICVIGVSGSGKTTLCRAISAVLEIPHIELDALYWEPNWQPAPRHEFLARLSNAVSQGAWVIDGNYSATRTITWPTADTIVWIDLPLHTVLWRLTRRIVTRSFLGTVLWNGNRETLWRHVVPSDSLIVWALRTHPRYRREYEPLLAERSVSGGTVIRLHTPEEVRAWLESLSRAMPGNPS